VSGMKTDSISRPSASLIRYFVVPSDDVWWVSTAGDPIVNVADSVCLSAWLRSSSD
jgi:hypothetical protein